MPILTDKNSETRSTAIAAAIILLAAMVLLYLMPDVIVWLGNVSPWLGTGFGVLVILAFFLVFWLRARYQRRKSR
jgi:Na+/proline symporter